MTKPQEIVVEQEPDAGAGRDAASLPVVQQQGAVVPVTPMQLLEMAVTGGADIDKLAKLMELDRQWKADQARNAFVVALAAFKADPPTILKNKQVSFTTAKGKTEYKHALSGAASEQIGAALATHGISHRWDVEQLDGGRIKVTCILTHVLGHSERVSMAAGADDSGGKNNIQALGSTTSYLQRYTLFAATGIVPKDADDDGKGGAPTMAMNDADKTAFAERIAATTNRKEAESLWTTIAAECTKIGDVESYAELHTLVGRKIKSFAAPKQQPQGDGDVI